MLPQSLPPAAAPERPDVGKGERRGASRGSTGGWGSFAGSTALAGAVLALGFATGAFLFRTETVRGIYPSGGTPALERTLSTPPAIPDSGAGTTGTERDTPHGPGVGQAVAAMQGAAKAALQRARRSALRDLSRTDGHIAALHQVDAAWYPVSRDGGRVEWEVEGGISGFDLTMPSAEWVRQGGGGYPAEAMERCRGTLGAWCYDFYSQEPDVGADTVLPDWSRMQPCRNGCGGAGRCDHTTGLCRCPAGWTGDACDVEMPRYCTDWYDMEGNPPRKGPKIDSNDELWLQSTGWTVSRCDARCDEQVGTCFCPEDSAYPDRQISYFCHMNTHPVTGKPHPTHGNVPADWVLMKSNGTHVGWCEADPVEVASGRIKLLYNCMCLLDGAVGTLCSTKIPQVCPNQCWGRGDCHTGFCKCHVGWTGPDCSLEIPKEHRDRLISAVREPAELSRFLSDVGPQVRADGPTAKTFGRVAANPLVEYKDKRSSLRDGGARPLVYVYDMDAQFVENLLQWRVNAQSCVYRTFGWSGAPEFTSDTYQVESMLHEALLQSRHRTYDPEEADLFYVPAYLACYIYPLYGAADWPHWPGLDGAKAGHLATRAGAATRMMMAVQASVASVLPYWDRSGGRDHVFLMPHDEGACYVPQAAWPAHMLASWGRLDIAHTSMSGYEADNYSAPARHPVYAPNGLVKEHGDHPCLDPAKDVVVPAFRGAHVYGQSPIVGALPPRKRNLMFFSGRGGEEWMPPKFSRGIRQTLYELHREGGWEERGLVMASGHTGAYSYELASSVFCLQVPGDGWGGRLEDAIANGCLPVVIEDRILDKFESNIDLSKFAVRVLESDMESLPEVLESFRPEEIKTMQENLARVWSRFVWTSTALARDGAQPLVDKYAGMGNEGRWADGEGERERLAERVLGRKRDLTGLRDDEELGDYLAGPAPRFDPIEGRDDALDTVLQVLWAMERQRAGRA